MHPTAISIRWHLDKKPLGQEDKTLRSIQLIANVTLSRGCQDFSQNNKYFMIQLAMHRHQLGSEGHLTVSL